MVAHHVTSRPSLRRRRAVVPFYTAQAILEIENLASADRYAPQISRLTVAVEFLRSHSALGVPVPDFAISRDPRAADLLRASRGDAQCDCRCSGSCRCSARRQRGRCGSHKRPGTRLTGPCSRGEGSSPHRRDGRRRTRTCSSPDPSQRNSRANWPRLFFAQLLVALLNSM